MCTDSWRLEANTGHACCKMDQHAELGLSDSVSEKSQIPDMLSAKCFRYRANWRHSLKLLLTM